MIMLTPGYSFVLVWRGLLLAISCRHFSRSVLKLYRPSSLSFSSGAGEDEADWSCPDSASTVITDFLEATSLPVNVPIHRDLEAVRLGHTAIFPVQYRRWTCLNG